MVTPLLELDPGLTKWFGTPEEVAPVVALLASAGAADDGPTGIVLGFDGGTLKAWSHPDLHASAAVEPRGDLDALISAFETLPRPTPNPDDFGQTVMRALGVQPLL
jgi:hypothetical protein